MKLWHRLLFLYAAILMTVPAIIMEQKAALPVCAAEEVMVSIGGRTVSSHSTFLDFNKCKISDYDAFSNELSQFTFLKRVELCGSNLNNAQMEKLQNLYPNIKFVWTLVLHNCWTVRTDQVAFSTNKGEKSRVDLTSEDAAQLKYCTDMVALDIGHNEVHDVSFLEYMPKLRILIVVDNHLADISPVAKCKDLVYLETFVNRITDMSPLTNLVNLIDINISYNRFADITPILHKPRVERLFVSHCGLSSKQIAELEAEYPNAQVEYQVKESIQAGWRTNPRFKAMRTMYKQNVVSDLFMTDTDRLAYYAAVFDLNYYVNTYPEIVEEVGTEPLQLLYYWLDYGVANGQKASAAFSVAQYAAYNPDLQAAYGDDYTKYLMHYMARGYKENRICS